MFIWNKPSKKSGIKFPLKAAMLSTVSLIFISFIFAIIYYIADKQSDSDKSELRGLKDKDNFGNYVYYSIIISSTLGLGEMVPYTDAEREESSWLMRIILCIHVICVFFMKDFIDSAENFLLS